MGIRNFAEKAPRKMPVKCEWRPWFDSLGEEQQALIIQAFDNPDWTTSAIVRELQEDGCPSSDTTIRAHRKFNCRSCNERDGRTV